LAAGSVRDRLEVGKGREEGRERWELAFAERLREYVSSDRLSYMYPAPGVDLSAAGKRARNKAGGGPQHELRCEPAKKFGRRYLKIKK
jgi:hypothetical protein